jgi:tRNA-2-methylthio-N6-dimethylallyladenosine synthase
MIELVELQRKINFENNQPHVGKVFEVLVEGKAKKPDQLMGRNEANKIVVFPDQGQQIGDFVNVVIDEVTPNTLIGLVV